MLRLNQWGRIHHTEFALWPWQACRAVLPPPTPDGNYGRCELRRGHPGDHALERGMFDIRFRVTDTTADPDNGGE